MFHVSVVFQLLTWHQNVLSQVPCCFLIFLNNILIEVTTFKIFSYPEFQDSAFSDSCVAPTSQVLTPIKLLFVGDSNLWNDKVSRGILFTLCIVKMSAFVSEKLIPEMRWNCILWAIINLTLNLNILLQCFPQLGSVSILWLLNFFHLVVLSMCSSNQI